MTDLEIIARPGRVWASLHANSVKAWRWLGPVYLEIPASTVRDIAEKIRATDLSLKVWDSPSLSSRPTVRELKNEEQKIFEKALRQSVKIVCVGKPTKEKA